MGIIEAIVAIVSVSSIGAIASSSLSIAQTAIAASVIYGGNALSKAFAPKRESYTNSPTYQFSSLQTQTNNQLPIPLIYGENKIAGNRLWQQLRENNTIIDRIISFGEGPIDSISDIRLNDLPIAQVAGVEYRLYTGNSGQIVDPIIQGDTQSRIKTVGSLKNLAYIAIAVTASQQVRSDYNLTALVKGRKVRVYSNPSTFTIEYSNNPAWCLLDFLTSYNGCGIGLNAKGERDNALIDEFIDINSFIEAAEFCDEPVNGAPRFTFNMIIDSQSQRREIIEEFKKACRGALTIKGKQLQLKIDMPKSPVKVIESSDLIAGTEQFFSLSKDENYDRIVVKYRSKSQEWAICEAIAEKPQFDNIPPIEHAVNIYSVTEHNQASRLAWYYLNKVARERSFGYFETDYRAFDLEIGDVIEFSDNLMNYASKLVKVTRVIDKNDGTFGVSWREYDPEVYTDTVGSMEPVTRLLALNDSFVTPGNVNGFCATTMLNTINLSWASFSDSSITYEIRLGDSWDSSQLVATNISSNTVYVPITATGFKKFLIKAKSKYNFYSNTESVATLYIDAIPSVNTILHNNLLETKIGISNAKIYNNKLKPAPSGVWGRTMPHTAQAPYTDSAGRWAQIAAAQEASFTTEIFDIKDRFVSLVSMVAKFTQNKDSQGFSAEIRTSADGTNWSDWKVFADGSFDFRFYQLKFVITNPEKATWALNNADLSIDVPDRDETYKNMVVSSPQNGLTIEFATHIQSKIKKDFIATPSIVANITGESVGYCVITQKSPKSLTVKTFDSSNNPICATCDIHVKGY